MEKERERNNEVKKSPPKNFILLDSASQESFIERREIIFKAVSAWVRQEREKDPAFNLSRANLNRWLKSNPGNVFGLKATNSVLRYWCGDLNALKIRLGLPAKLRIDE